MNHKLIHWRDHLNPQLVNSTLEIIVSGTDTSIVMVEGECKEISEELSSGGSLSLATNILKRLMICNVSWLQCLK
ncbi:MAG: hypothetical protein IPP08_00005 [Chlorobiota bacterium]|nr:MAG: hypothetical protein IPP08_00005 [Chlorobiota bacterium]